ncbi:uncharacterized protein V6R79_014259 [Siganus canaliculatus]
MVTGQFTIDICDAEREQLLIDLKNTRFISVWIDGATDSGILENEIVYVKYFTKEKGPVQSYLGIGVNHALANGVLSAVQSVFEKAGLENWKEKVVNMGIKHGVACPKLKKDVGHLLSIHCVAHRLESGMVDSIKAQPELKKLQEVLHLLYMQYHYSPKAQREQRELDDALEDKILCNGYGVFVAHFEDQYCGPSSLPWTITHGQNPVAGGQSQKEAFVLHGRAEMEFLCHHHSSILEREGTTASER